MRVETSLKRQRAACGMLRDIWTQAAAQGLTQEQIHSDEQHVWASIASETGCPGWVREYVRGYRNCLYDTATRGLRMLYYVPGSNGYGGTLHSCCHGDADYYAVAGYSAADMLRVGVLAQYWQLADGTHKPYSVFHGCSGSAVAS